MKFLAEILVHGSRINLVDQIDHVFLKLVDVGEAAVDAILHDSFYTMTGVQQGLLAYVVLELSEN